MFKELDPLLHSTIAARRDIHPPSVEEAEFVYPGKDAGDKAGNLECTDRQN